jgi:hypothetical protein
MNINSTWAVSNLELVSLLRGKSDAQNKLKAVRSYNPYTF